MVGWCSMGTFNDPCAEKFDTHDLDHSWPYAFVRAFVTAQMTQAFPLCSGRIWRAFKVNKLCAVAMPKHAKTSSEVQNARCREVSDTRHLNLQFVTACHRSEQTTTVPSQNWRTMIPHDDCFEKSVLETSNHSVAPRNHQSDFVPLIDPSSQDILTMAGKCSFTDVSLV